MSLVPSTGQIVDIRRRRYVVQNVRAVEQPLDELLPDELARRLISFPRYHVLSLSSVEDDSLGQERQVVWEIEPGAVAHQSVALPRPGEYSQGGAAFDSPARFDAFLHAVRWGVISSAEFLPPIPRRCKRRFAPASRFRIISSIRSRALCGCRASAC